MNCHLLRSQLIELARGRLPDAIDRDRVMAHLKICPSCRLLMEEQMALTAAFEEFNLETEAAPPANLESIVLVEFASNRAFHRRRLKAAAMIGAIAAVLVGLAAIPRAFMTPPPSRLQTVAAISPAVRVTDPPLQEPVSKPVRRHATRPARDAEPFVAIPYTVPLDPRERAVVMRMEMPVTALAAVGLAVAAPDPLASAQADVIVGEDGRIRAIRLLSISNSNSDRSVNP
jgi:predicted anti-sigma-YlaC factor YlaD